MPDVYILCTRHSRSVDENLCWYAKNFSGYTTNLDWAWKGPEEEARKKLGRSLDLVVAAEKVDAVSERVVQIWAEGLRKESHAVAARFTDKDHPDDAEVAAVAAAFTADDDNDREGDDVECPWCGLRIEDALDGRIAPVGVDSEWLDHCDCGKAFAVRVIESEFTFRTARVVEKGAGDAAEP